MDDWELMFQQASGQNVVGSQKRSAEDSDKEEERVEMKKKKKKRKNKLKAQSASLSAAAANSTSSFLTSRLEIMKFDNEIFFSLFEAKGLIKGLMGGVTSNCKKFELKDSAPCKYCRHCNRHLMEHCLVSTINEYRYPFIRCFLTVRSCRILLSSFINDCERKQSGMSKECLRAVRQLCHNLINFIIYLKIPEDEKTMIEDKINLLEQSIQGYRGNSKVDPLQFSAIEACDAVYYRLYYNLLLFYSTLNTRSREDSEEVNYLKYFHPHNYFGFLLVPDELDLIEEEYYQNTPVNNPLYLIYLTRVKEMEHLSKTCMKDMNRKPILLSGYQRALNSSLKSSSMIPNSNVAPESVRSYRNSIRDFPNHLYSYICLSNKNLNQLQSVMMELKKSLDISIVVEIGGGTGYLAHLLHQALGNQYQIKVYDEAPPDMVMSNSYHGNVPSFFPIHKGTEKALKYHENDKYALLLCYPPPSEPMAYNCLKYYLHGKKVSRNKPKVLVHIGEFKGLTGSKDFETLLTGEMICIERITTPLWGSDAANVTVWVDKMTHSTSEFHGSDILIPCSSCGEEALSRCIPFRSINYCSKSCKDKHSPQRKIIFEKNLIPGEVVESRLVFGKMDRYIAGKDYEDDKT